MLVPSLWWQCTHQVNPTTGRPLRVRTLEPLAGNLAGKLFGVGLIGAALLAASILPLSTAYSVSEFVGRESALDDRPREAPLFYGTYAVIVTGSAALILVPGAPLVSILVLTQILNAVVLLLCSRSCSGSPATRSSMGEHVANRSAAAPYLIAIGFIAVCVGSLAVLSLSWTREQSPNGQREDRVGMEVSQRRRPMLTQLLAPTLAAR